LTALNGEKCERQISNRHRASLNQAEISTRVLELLSPEFTLIELQRTVEAISGRHRTSGIFVGWKNPAPGSNRRA